MDKDYIYDCETSDTIVYRNKYTGKEIHIPKEPTNGDIIMAMFPNTKINKRLEGLEVYECIYVNVDNLGALWKIRGDWWNSPYESQRREG